MAVEGTSGLTSAAFEKLLERLGPDREEAAHAYETVRRKLIDFFSWRGSSQPALHADETLDRVARRLEEGAAVEHIPRYSYGVARRVLLEWQRARPRLTAAAEDWRLATTVEGPSIDEPSASCLDRCLDALPAESRTLIVSYYEGKGRSHLEERKDLAAHLGISYVSLKTRAHRIRIDLQRCVHQCLGGPAGGEA